MVPVTDLCWPSCWGGTTAWEHDVPQSQSSPEQVVVQCRQRGSHGQFQTVLCTQAVTHPAAAAREACFTSLPWPCVKVTASSLSVFSLKTWEQWIVSCLHLWTHSARVLNKGYELLSTEENAQLDLTQNKHAGSWPMSTHTKASLIRAAAAHAAQCELCSHLRECSAVTIERHIRRWKYASFIPISTDFIVVIQSAEVVQGVNLPRPKQWALPGFSMVSICVALKPWADTSQ